MAEVRQQSLNEFIKNVREMRTKEYKVKDFGIKQIYVNKKKLTTTVLWLDGDHTTVKLNTDDPFVQKEFDVYYAVCAAVAKRLYESNTRFKKIIAEKVVYQGKKRDK